MASKAYRKASLAISLFFVILIFSGTAQAKIFYVDDDAAGANDGSSWADAYKYLQDALAAAANGDEIRVAEGTYKPDRNSAYSDGSGDRSATFQLINGVAVEGGYAGAGKPEPDTRDIALYETILSGDLAGNDNEVEDPCSMLFDPARAENSQHIVTGSGTNLTAVLDGFTITGGNATDPVNKIGENYWGAGLNNRYGSPTVNNCTFSTNSSRNGGSGIYSYNSSPAVTNCTFSQNATRGGGSGMKNDDNSNPIIINCAFNNNYSINHGAAMNNGSGSNPMLVNCLFNANTGRLGGAMYNSTYLSASNPTLINCTFTSNTAVLSGGGISNRGGSTPTLVNCILWGNSDNTGTGESAQIYSHSGSPIINHSCIQDWTGALGGTGNIGLDPRFADFANSDYHLQPGSPCLDAGDNSAIPASVLTDLDGNPRIKHGIVDMGVYETLLTFYVDMDATGANDGSSWADAYNYLQDALITASKGDEIRVAQGIYKPDQGGSQTPGDREATFQLVNGVALKGGYAGAGQQDPNAQVNHYETILSGDIAGNDIDVNNPSDLLGDPCRAENSYHVVTGSGCDETAVLDGFTVTGGNANGSAWPNGIGGGMRNSFGSPTVLNCTFRGNSAKSGGGMDADSSAVFDCTFTGNSASFCGGAVDVGGYGATIVRCTVAGNLAEEGGGIGLRSSRMTTVVNCTITGNLADRGGGVFTSLSNPILTNSMLSGNSARDGGAIYSESGIPPGPPNLTFSAEAICNQGMGTNGNWYSPTLNNCILSGNSAEYSGGGMYTGDCDPNLINCTFAGNSAEEVGGGMYNSRSSSTLTNCIFSGNSADWGGGIYNVWGGPALDGCTFSKNSASSRGGGIQNEYSDTTVTDCMFTGNSARYGGGMSQDSGDVKVTRCTFSNNIADYGGGMINLSGLMLSNCIFTGNSAIDGGGLFNDYGTPTVNNCTFCDNSAELGGGIYCYYSERSTMKNCILWGNTADSGPQIALENSHNQSTSYCDIEDGWPGEGNIDADPRFVDPGYSDSNGLWIDGDYHLLPGSPCIDAGDPDYIAEPNETDLDGNPRVIGLRIDMGAYESPLPAEVRIAPRTINLASKGNWITCYIWLPQEYDVTDIESNRVLLNGQVKAESVLPDERQQVAAARFSREDIQAILHIGEVKLTISGQLTDGNIFEGTDTIKVTDKAVKK